MNGVRAGLDEGKCKGRREKDLCSANAGVEEEKGGGGESRNKWLCLCDWFSFGRADDSHWARKKETVRTDEADE